MTRLRSDLERQARDFAAEITGLLNGTVTNGIRLSSWIDPNGNAIIRYGRQDSGALDNLVPLTVSQKQARFGLRIFRTLTLDDESRHLRNTQSAYVLATADGEAVFTYDFVRPAPTTAPASGREPTRRQMRCCSGVSTR
ncbi:hypothetical protein [Candidatus Poriferisodalis sp.]|uniref:hypothetical protein n=1 Tax=Candidatus Poriferisodalis sp. TaxID=3101277 RepID=UPI003B0109CE